LVSAQGEGRNGQPGTDFSAPQFRFRLLYRVEHPISVGTTVIYKGEFSA